LTLLKQSNCFRIRTPRPARLAADDEGNQEDSLSDAAVSSTAREDRPLIAQIEQPVYQPARSRRWLAWVAAPAVIVGLFGAAIFTFRHFERAALAKGSESRAASPVSHHTPSPRAEELYLHGLECPAFFVPVLMRETGQKGAEDG
jgi:hypothetical protein